MTLTRYEIRNEYGLADKELYNSANKDDSEALLEAASMAGLVGVLRQLGDLAEFAAEVFHGLHEEVMTTATRGHGLAMRLQQLEAEFPSIEIPILSQTDHSTFFYDQGLEWHPNPRREEKLISPHKLPHCILDSYEECRAPPQLFLLDKFDVLGSGSCLKRYSDPSMLKTTTASSALVIVTSKLSNDDKPPRKPKTKGSHTTTSGEAPGDSQTSHSKLHQLFLLEQVENGQRNPHEFHVKLKTRQLNGFLPINSSYMEIFLKTCLPYCESVHQSSPAMETQVTVLIPSLEMESISDDDRHEIGPETTSCVNSNDTEAEAKEAKQVESDDHKSGCNLGFPGFGQTQICVNADVSQSQRELMSEGESSLVSCTECNPHNKAADEDSAGVETLELPFSYEKKPLNLPEFSCLELESNKSNASDEIGSKSAQAAHPVGVTKVVVVPNYVQHVENESELSFSAVVDDRVSNREMEALEPVDISSDSRISFEETLGPGCLVPNQYKTKSSSSTYDDDDFGNLYLAADAQEEDNVVPKEDEMNYSHSGHVSTFGVSPENGTLRDSFPKPDLNDCSESKVPIPPPAGGNQNALNPIIDLEEDISYPSPPVTLDSSTISISSENIIIQTQQYNRGQDSCSSENIIITASAHSLPPPIQDDYDDDDDVQGSLSEEAFPSCIAEIEAALCAPSSLNDLNISESFQENFSEVSMVLFPASLHETPQEDPDVTTPPLPPLPPTQWWMGKLFQSVKATTETPVSPVTSLAGSHNNNSTYIQSRDIDNTAKGSPQATEAEYPSAEATLNEPCEATEELQSINGTSLATNMHSNGSTPKADEESFASSVSLLVTAEEATTDQGLEGDWRSEAMALEWFTQNLRSHANLEEQEEEPNQPPPVNSYDQNQNPRDNYDSLVIGIDRSMLRKVSERNKTQVGGRVDENDSLLEIIRNKSFNLRRADASMRPNFQVGVPMTNLKVAAILEKANTLRQAMVGSDDDQDSDSWSE